MRLRTIEHLLIVAAVGGVIWGWSMVPASATQGDTTTSIALQATTEPAEGSNTGDDPSSGEGGDDPSSGEDGDTDSDGDTGAGEDGPEEEPAPEGPVAEREDDIAFWWWVAVIVVGIAAASGIMFSLGRRNRHEAWLHQSAAACDTGHSVVKGLTGIIDDPSVLPLSQQNQARLDAYARRLEVLVESAPDDRSRALAAPVHAAIQVVQQALVADEAHKTVEDLEVAKAALDGAVSEFAAGIDLEAVRAGQPSSRPSA